MTITSSCGTLTHHRWPGRLRRTWNKTSSADQGWDDDGICDECFGQTFVTDGQRFRGRLTRKKRQTTAAARQHALSYLNDSRRTCTGRKGDVGNTAEKGKGVFLSWKTWWSIEYCEFEDVHLKRKSSFPCCVQLKLTKLFIHMDICFRSLPIQKKREKGEKQWFWRVAEVVFVTSVSQSQCHFLVDIILVIHVSYYIAVYLNVVVLFMVWTCVKGGDVKVSTGKCFIFVMKYIKLTYIQAGMMFISFLVFAFI